MSRLTTSSFTCQLIFVIITTLSIHHSFTSGSNLSFKQILQTLILLLPWTAFTIMGPDRTYHASQFIFSSFFSIIFLFVPCGRLSWLHASFSCMLNTQYCIVSRAKMQLIFTNFAALMPYATILSAFFGSSLPEMFQGSLLR